MTPSHLIRLSGLALMLGCVLFVITQLIRGYALLNPTSYLVVAGFVGPITLVAGPLVVLGLVGMYARQVGVAGVLWLIAFVIVFFGSTFVIGVYWYNAFVVPAIPPAQASLYSLALILAYALVYLGWLLVGVSILRRPRLFPRSAAVLLIVVSLAGGVISVVQPPEGLPNFGSALSYASVLVNVLFYAIIARLGLALWSKGSTSEDLMQKPGL